MLIWDDTFDIIVIGAGHAGCEAALAAARMGCKTLIITTNVDNIALMSCNPAIGGLGKTHLVREVDALGGEMARNIDETGIQFRMLNTRKGPAVRALRAQADKQLYRMRMKYVLEREEYLSVKQDMATKIIASQGKIDGIETIIGQRYKAKAVILATGTFLNGLIHIGLFNYNAGRAGDFPSLELSDSIKELGLQMGRLKTGTTPRLNSKTIDFSQTEEQTGDEEVRPFSYRTLEMKSGQTQVSCYITYTNECTHEIIRSGLDRSPLYSGVIKGIGPRYCPSIEDKIVRFSDKNRHQIFLEPEGLNTNEIYANGIPTSLPYDIQVEFLHTIKGLEKVEIIRPGYAIEYDFVFPTQLRYTLETKKIEGLYLAGQINGTSGYEEAAAQGLIAGMNAVLKIKKKKEFILTRAEAYMGVMIDDLVTKGLEEPYRMFTSRAEYRLMLRQDNADLRLMEYGYEFGLIDKETFTRFKRKKELIKEEIIFLKNKRINPNRLKLDQESKDNEPLPLETLLKRPEVSYNKLIAEIEEIVKESPSFKESDNDLRNDVQKETEVEVKYEGYIKRQLVDIERFKKLESKRIPQEINYDVIPGLSNEVRQRLKEHRPVSLGQVSRLSGITPSAISTLMVYLEKLKRETRALVSTT
ncbi:MAG: tRNA uridine-5-carboxymethylaminomethyl(34) synthesis enzyme MnmG [bacterium]